MTREQVLTAIETVLRDKLKVAGMKNFSPTARLNEDLHLDSVLMLELLLAIELDHGLTLPEEMFNRQDLSTVGDLARLYEETASPRVEKAKRQMLRYTHAEAEAASREGVHGEDYIDIKVHCVVSNLSHAVKKRGLDHRPFFFGVWDADFAIEDRWRLTYHAPSINHDFYRHWFTRLYGPRVRQWHRPEQSKDENLRTMLALLDNKKPSEFVMVMLDLFHLPERENKFNQNPFPHYLMLENSSDPEIWTVLDPDFRWEGAIEKSTVINAIRQPTVAGGFIFDSADIRRPSPQALHDYFLACMKEHENPFTSAVRSIVKAHLEGRDGLRLRDLGLALRELPVLSIRKYAIEHGFAFFWRDLKLSNAEFDVICDEIEALIQEFRSLHYAILKLAETEDALLAGDVFDRLDRADGMERQLKAQLIQTFRLWCEAKVYADGPDVRKAVNG